MQLQTYEALDIPVAGNATGSDTTLLNPLLSASIGLCASSVSITRTNVIADFTAHESTFDGYARKVITWNKPERLDNGTIGCVGTAAEWRPTGSTSPGSVYSIFITGSTSTTLMAAGALDDAPVPMEDAHSALVVTVIFNPVTGGIIIDVA